MSAPERLTAHEAVSRLATGDLTAETLTRACLDRARAGAEIKGWAWLDPEQALTQARAVDRADRKGPLARRSGRDQGRHRYRRYADGTRLADIPR